MTKNDLRERFILPAINAFEQKMEEGVTECKPFWKEAIDHPEYPTSKAYDWLNKLEGTMTTDAEEATWFEVLVCKNISKIAKLLADWDNSSEVFE